MNADQMIRDLESGASAPEDWSPPARTAHVCPVCEAVVPDEASKDAESGDGAAYVAHIRREHPDRETPLGVPYAVVIVLEAETGCPECGRDIDRLGGNQDCGSCAAEPDAAGNVPDQVLEALGFDVASGICSLHATSVGHATGSCSRCDECDHEDASHVRDLESPTCWSESRCSECPPVRTVRCLADGCEKTASAPYDLEYVCSDHVAEVLGDGATER